MSYETEVCPILHQLYKKGRYGRTADAGYYDYSDRDEPDIPVDAGQEFDPLLVWAPIVNGAAKMVENNIASVEDIDTGAELGGNWPIGPLEKCDKWVPTSFWNASPKSPAAISTRKSVPRHFPVIC